jgi:hypothetical protein
MEEQFQPLENAVQGGFCVVSAEAI